MEDFKGLIERMGRNPRSLGAFLIIDKKLTSDEARSNDGPALDLENFKLFCRLLPETRITFLGFSEVNLSAAQVDALSAVLPRTQINRLYFSLNYTQNPLERPTFLEALKQTPSIKIVELFRTGNTREVPFNIGPFAQQLPHLSLTRLVLDDHNIGDEQVLALSEALPHSALKELSIRYGTVTVVGARALARVLPNTKLTQLTLETHPLGNEGISALAEALPRTQLLRLDLWDTGIDLESLKVLASHLVESPLTHLRLSYNKNIRGEGASVLAEFLPRTRIKSLEMSSCEIDARGVKALAKALPTSQITRLDIGYSNIGHLGIKALAEVLPQTQISELRLRRVGNGKPGDSNTYMASHANITPILEILPATQITSLDIGGIDLKDSLETLATVLPNTRIIKLDLLDSEFSPESIKKLFQILPQSQVISLGITFKAIDNESVMCLAEVLPSTHIASFTLIHLNREIQQEPVMQLLNSIIRSRISKCDMRGIPSSTLQTHVIEIINARSQEVMGAVDANDWDKIQSLLEGVVSACAKYDYYRGSLLHIAAKEDNMELAHLVLRAAEQQGCLPAVLCQQHPVTFTTAREIAREQDHTELERLLAIAEQKYVAPPKTSESVREEASSSAPQKRKKMDAPPPSNRLTRSMARVPD